MATYSIKEFAELTGKEAKDIHVYISRGKVVKNTDKKIDTTNALNLLFFEKHRINGIVPYTEKTPKGRKVNKEGVTQREHSKILEKISSLNASIKEVDLKNKELLFQKQKGKLINAEQTIEVVKTHNSTLLKELDQNIKTFIQDICARHGIESAKMGEYTLKVAKIINKSNKSAIELLLKEIGR